MVHVRACSRCEETTYCIHTLHAYIHACIYSFGPQICTQSLSRAVDQMFAHLVLVDLSRPNLSFRLKLLSRDRSYVKFLSTYYLVTFPGVSFSILHSRSLTILFINRIVLRSGTDRDGASGSGGNNNNNNDSPLPNPPIHPTLADVLAP